MTSVKKAMNFLLCGMNYGKMYTVYLIILQENITANGWQLFFISWLLLSCLIREKYFPHFKSDNCLAPRIWKIHVKELRLLLKHGKEEHGNDTVHCGRVRSKEKPHILTYPWKTSREEKKNSCWERCIEFLFLTSSILTQPSISRLILFRACVPWKQVTLQPLTPTYSVGQGEEEGITFCSLSNLRLMKGKYLWRLTPGYDPPAQQRCRKARTQVTFECYL